MKHFPINKSNPDTEEICIGYEEKFNKQINAKFGKDGILNLSKDNEALFEYRHWVWSIIHQNYSRIETYDIVPRILLRVHRFYRSEYTTDIPDVKHRALIDEYETFSHYTFN